MPVGAFLGGGKQPQPSIGNKKVRFRKAQQGAIDGQDGQATIRDERAIRTGPVAEPAGSDTKRR